MGIMQTDGGDYILPRTQKTRAEDIAAELEQATQELQASRERSQRTKVETDRLAGATDEVLARIKARLTEA